MGRCSGDMLHSGEGRGDRLDGFATVCVDAFSCTFLSVYVVSIGDADVAIKPNKCIIAYGAVHKPLPSNRSVE